MLIHEDNYNYDKVLNLVDKNIYEVNLSGAIVFMENLENII